ncbi:class I SAM-dependent methyltransferase [Croceicoccus naphthovorans]|uniref:Trans-aconitate methyltransferase n=1 Tax=Croceicoccus naphthovorans TaxID=1348774 RepID=A0A0G3XF76_9SPHN|nr:class I SAM-dependent methyltransferase [Croceicoccus naphthovorans]AKM10170.1 trans-aconitate methyltransferase [Croceicoccus naphthovorans]MBB3990598.1 trans-aconitate methyltransferase [Croceicoccus naphthovorans]
MAEAGTPQAWDAKAYGTFGSFVPALGQAVLDLLAPVAGESILDLGCGDGVLTARIAETGADVLGHDADAGLLARAKERGLAVRQGDGQALDYDDAFDAVFSNAALHWMPDHPAVYAGVYRALKPGGRFACECGGFGNIAAIRTAIRAVAERHGQDPIDRQNYPSVVRATRELEAAGFRVDAIALNPRPTPLADGMAAWLNTFRHGFFDQQGGAAMIAETTELLAPQLQDPDGNWTADYVRLRFLAFKD